MRIRLFAALLPALLPLAIGCDETPKDVPAIADPAEVEAGLEEEIDHQNETMKGHGEVDVDAEKQMKVETGQAEEGSADGEGE